MKTAREFTELVEEIARSANISSEAAEAAVMADLRANRLLVTAAVHWEVTEAMPVTGAAFE